MCWCNFILNTSPCKEIKVGVVKMFRFIADRGSAMVGKINGIAAN